MAILRIGWIPFLAVFLGWALAQAPFLQRLDLVLNDAQQHLASQEHYFQDAVVLDIDEASRLAGQPLLIAFCQQGRDEAQAGRGIGEDGRHARAPLGATFSVWALHFLLLTAWMQKAPLVAVLLALVFGWLLHLMAERRRLSLRAHQLEAESDLDSLTGLPVRRAFLRAFKREMASSSRYGRPLSVAVLDLDHFKRVNDTYGHPMGDAVLKRFASVLRESLRQSDIAGRWGGEEFVVLLPETPLEGVADLLDKVRLAISAEHFPPPADVLTVTMSAGLTLFDGHESDPEAIVGQADRALYEAKESGRNRVNVKDGREVLQVTS